MTASDFYTSFSKSVDILKRLDAVTYYHSPRKLVFKTGGVSLYHYVNTANKDTVPLLLVFATVNRPEILDIFEDRSLIKDLLRKHQDIYLLDWGYPSQHDVNTTFDDYVTSLDACVKHICQQTNMQKINLLGVCQGGVISLCYAALSKHVKHLTLISTPIDFHTDDNLVSQLLNKLDIEMLAETQNMIPGSWLTDFFISLRPFELVGKKYLRFLENIDNKIYTDRFLQVEKWLRDAPDQPSKAFSQFVKEFYQQNKLIAGKITIGNQKVNLKNITIPILNIMASEDEIVPMSASNTLGTFVASSAYHSVIFPSGHIGIYVSDKVGTELANAIVEDLYCSSPPIIA